MIVKFNIINYIIIYSRSHAMMVREINGALLPGESCFHEVMVSLIYYKFCSRKYRNIY